MSTPTIPAGNLYMNATLYTGTGSSQTINNGVAGQSFAPDMVWIKNRSGVWNHVLVDTIRGGTNPVNPNTSDAQNTDNVITAFNSNGFTVGVSGNSNNSGNNFVGWNWKAGGTAVSNTAGSITSQVSANTTSGFSVVTYTGNGSTNQTVGHGLGVAPSMIIIKNRSTSIDWIVYHASIGATGFLYLDLTTGTTTSSNPFNNTAPTSSVFTIAGNSSNSYVNGNGNSMVAYCWAPIAGYSAFGSYTGNGSTDGPFIYCGFRPRFIIFKRADGASNWLLLDSSRSPYNLVNQDLFADSAIAESTGGGIDFLSNGFKWRGTDTPGNGTTGTYIYAAFAENPFKYANAR